jgi:molybdate transport system permease protein
VSASRAALARGLDLWTAAVVLGLLLPVLALGATTSLADLSAGLAHPAVGPALALSARTSLLSLGLVVLGGTPVAWRLARSEGRGARLAEALIELPVVLPPAVIGLGLLLALGRRSPLGAGLEALGHPVAFTEAAVVIAQTVAAAPFYLRAAIGAFRAVDEDLWLVARSLGATPLRALLGIAVPIAAPGLVAGAALAWARALGEFGATLLFAGRLPGRTETMPLAIYAALESDVSAARALALILCAVAFAVLLFLRAAGAVRRRAEAAG